MRATPTLQAISRFTGLWLPFVLAAVFLGGPVIKAVAPQFWPWDQEDDKTGLGVVLLVLAATTLYLDRRIASLATPPAIDFLSLDQSIRIGLDALRRGDSLTMLGYSSNSLLTAVLSRNDITLGAVKLLLHENSRAQHSLDGWKKLEATGKVKKLTVAYTSRTPTSYIIAFGDQVLIVGRYSPEQSQTALGIDWHDPFLLRGNTASSIRIITEHTRWITALIAAQQEADAAAAKQGQP